MAKQAARLDGEEVSGGGIVDISLEDAVLIQKAALVALIQMSPEERLAKVSLPERYATEHLRAVYQNLPEFDPASLKARGVIVRAASLLRSKHTISGYESCECGHLWEEHEQPASTISWDVCSFPCVKCDCNEFEVVTKKEN